MKERKIYFTSDLHGYVYPTDYVERNEKNIGLLNIINHFNKDGNTLIIDGGDTIQGSPFTNYLSNSEFDIHPISTVMNAGGYDFITLGNHDFNYGKKYLKKYLDNLNATCLCTNVIDKTNLILLTPTTAPSFVILALSVKVTTTSYKSGWETSSTTITTLLELKVGKSIFLLSALTSPISISE